MFLIDELLFLNNYFSRNMHKNALFLLKYCKNCSALGASSDSLPLVSRDLALNFARTPVKHNQDS